MNEQNCTLHPQPDLMDIDDKLMLFLDKETLQMTIDHCTMKGIPLDEVRNFTELEFRFQLAKLMLAGKYRIAPPHILLIPKPDSDEKRKVYCNNAIDRIICTQIAHVYNQMYKDLIPPCCVSYQKGGGRSTHRQEHLAVPYDPSRTDWLGDGYPWHGSEAFSGLPEQHG